MVSLISEYRIEIVKSPWNWSEAESGINRLEAKWRCDVLWIKSGAPEDSYQSWLPPPFPPKHLSLPAFPFFFPSHLSSIHSHSKSIFYLTFPTIFPSISDQSLLSALKQRSYRWADGSFLRPLYLKGRSSAWTSHQDITERRSDPTSDAHAIFSVGPAELS